eukprot:TRINITY_DN49880_c0_g1_i1.p1 TRINITY_DN49880_c0_g1~~TRINITY_DN49880_c0_g1_i1.p1  ORF type:complete len:472 (+),score=61.31 TRINITY_DN49880_c0_g1_i1:134-1549(+)
MCIRDSINAEYGGSRTMGNCNTCAKGSKERELSASRIEERSQGDAGGSSEVRAKKTVDVVRRKHRRPTPVHHLLVSPSTGSSDQSEVLRKIVSEEQKAKDRRDERELAKKAEAAMYRAAADAAKSDGVEYTRVFGVTCTQASERSGGGCPAPIKEACRWLHEHGLRQVGLFRVPGRSRAVTYWKDRFNVDPTIAIPETEPVETVTSLIVQWLKLLKCDQGNRTYIYIGRDEEAHSETFNLQKEMQQFRRATKQSADLNFVRKSLQQLPEVQREVLREITSVLHAASAPENATINKMNSYNFAMCTFPEIMASVQIMIEDHDAVFSRLYSDKMFQPPELAKFSRGSGDSNYSLPEEITNSQASTPKNEMSVPDALNQFSTDDPRYMKALGRSQLAQDNLKRNSQLRASEETKPSRRQPPLRKAKSDIPVEGEADASGLTGFGWFRGCKVCGTQFKTPLQIRMHASSCPGRRR